RDADDTTAEQHREVAGELERLAPAHDAERIWAAGDRHLYLTGLGRPDAGRDDAVRFALSARSTIGGDGGASGVDGVGVHIGLAAGTVATGVVGGAHVAFGVWGEPVRIALALDAVAAAGEVLATRDLVEQLDRPVTLADERDITLGPDTIAAVALA
ncbi:MAG: adenylate/guanylate cyclase domain-containing protein, partial [Ilumatobacteraceae bacterium]